MSWMAEEWIEELTRAQEAARADPAALDGLRDAFLRGAGSRAAMSRVEGILGAIVGKGLDPVDRQDLAAAVLKHLVVVGRQGTPLLSVSQWPSWFDTLVRNKALDVLRARETRRRRLPAGDPDAASVESFPDPSAVTPEEAVLSAFEKAHGVRTKCLAKCRDEMKKRPTQQRRTVAIEVFAASDGDTWATMCAEFNRKTGEKLIVNTFEVLVGRALAGLGACVKECVEAHHE